MSMLSQSELSSDEHSFMETEYFQTDVPSLVEDETLQNMSVEGVPEDCEDVLFDVISELQHPKTVSDEGDPEDYEGASFDDAYYDLHHSQNVEWSNDAYREFIEIVNKHHLSNSAGDTFINLFNKFSNLDISLLPPSTKAGKEFLDNSAIPYMMFKEIPVETFQNVRYTFFYRSLIKTIKSLLMIDNINQLLVL